MDNNNLIYKIQYGNRNVLYIREINQRLKYRIGKNQININIHENNNCFNLPKYKKLKILISTIQEYYFQDLIILKRKKL